MNKEKNRKKRGRNLPLEMPPLIPDTPENVAKAIVNYRPSYKSGEWPHELEYQEANKRYQEERG